MTNSPVYSQEVVVFYDTDSGGVVSNIAFLRFVEKARCQLFASLGMDLPSMTDTGIYPTVIRTEIDYLKPGHLGDQITVEASVESIAKLRIQCQFIVYLSQESSSEDRTVLAQAQQSVVLVKMPDGKPVRPPKEWLG